jgi:2-chlorobenzoate 1,2-dioxygenase
MQLRTVVPLSVDRTRIEIYSFRLKGAPDWVNNRILAFANTIHSPASLVRADDLENFERIQDGYQARSAPWVSAHRELAKEADPVGPSHAMSERYVRNQFAAWTAYMGAS